MNEEDLRQNIEGLIKDCYDLGVAHVNQRRLEELWTDKIDQFKTVVDGYVVIKRKNLLQSILEVVKTTGEGLASNLVRNMGAKASEQLFKRQGIIEMKNAIIHEVEKL